MKRRLKLIAIAAFLVWFFHGAYVGLTHVSTGENLPSVKWLPATASNVSFYRSYSNTSYEFDIPESEFVKWSRWKLSPIDKPIRMYRYCSFTFDAPEPGPDGTAEDWQVFRAKRASLVATISTGLQYKFTQKNGGGVWVAYDRSIGRAYYHDAPR